MQGIWPNSGWSQDHSEGIIVQTVEYDDWRILPTYNIHTHTHPFNSPFSGTTRVSPYQKGKPIWILLKQETVSSSGISWAICKSAPHSRQLTMPAPHYSGFSRPDALPAAQPTASKHWRPKHTTYTWSLNLDSRLGISIIKMQSDKFVFLFHKADSFTEE